MSDRKSSGLGSRAMEQLCAMEKTAYDMQKKSLIKEKESLEKTRQALKGTAREVAVALNTARKNFDDKKQVLDKISGHSAEFKHAIMKAEEFMLAKEKSLLEKLEDFSMQKQSI